MGNGFGMYSEDRDSGERKEKGGQGQFGGPCDPPVYPFLNTGTQYSETQPSSGILGREPPPLDCGRGPPSPPAQAWAPSRVRRTSRCCPWPHSPPLGEGGGERGRGGGWAERGCRRMTGSQFQNSGGSPRSTTAVRRTKKGIWRHRGTRLTPCPSLGSLAAAAWSWSPGRTLSPPSPSQVRPPKAAATFETGGPDGSLLWL